MFDTTANKFRYLRTDVVYENTSTGINSLLSAAITPATDTTGAPQIYEAEFVLPAGGSNLYLIYDYRSSASQQLCYSDVNIEDSCCNCTFPTPTPTPTPTPSPTPTPIPSYNYYEATDCDGGNLVYLKSCNCFVSICSDFNVSPILTSSFIFFPIRFFNSEY